MATKSLDWTRLPSNLRFIIEPAEKYGWIQFGEQIDEFEQTGTDAQKSELKKLADRLWNERDAEDGHAVVAWVAKQDIVKDEAAAHVEFLLVLMTELGYS